MVVSLMTNPDKGRLIKLSCRVMTKFACAVGMTLKSVVLTLGSFLMFIVWIVDMQEPTVVENVTSLLKNGRVI